MSDTVLNWFQSYLDGRLFAVSFSNQLSDKFTLRYGVPQGSILGPLLLQILLFHMLTDCNVFRTVQPMSSQMQENMIMSLPC